MMRGRLGDVSLGFSLFLLLLVGFHIPFLACLHWWSRTLSIHWGEGVIC